MVVLDYPSSADHKKEKNDSANYSDHAECRLFDTVAGLVAVLVVAAVTSLIVILVF